MLEQRFCYEIAAKAGLAYDTETGKDAPCYSEVTFEGGIPIEEEEYKVLHEKMKKRLAQQVGIDESLITCISQEEYDRSAAERE